MNILVVRRYSKIQTMKRFVKVYLAQKQYSVLL
jgi:hypothetical protein